MQGLPGEVPISLTAGKVPVLQAWEAWDVGSHLCLQELCVLNDILVCTSVQQPIFLHQDAVWVFLLQMLKPYSNLIKLIYGLR